MPASFRAGASDYSYSTATVTMTKPTGTADGDVLLAMWVTSTTTASVDTLPSGWSLLHNVGLSTSPGIRAFLFAKDAGGSEPASYDFVFSENTNGCWLIGAWQDSAGIDVSGASAVSDILSTPYTATAPSITTTVNDTLNVWCAAVRFTSATATPVFTVPSGYTSRLQELLNGDYRAGAFADYGQATAGSSGTAAGTCAVTSGGNGRTIAFHVALKPLADTYVGRPSSDVSAGTFTASSGSDLYAMLDEETPSDADYITASSAGTAEVKFSAIDAPPSGWQTVVRYRISGDCTVSLREGGSTEIASWAHSPGPGSPTTYERTLNGTEQGNVTDWGDLRLRVVKA